MNHGARLDPPWSQLCSRMSGLNEGATISAMLARSDVVRGLLLCAALSLSCSGSHHTPNLEEPTLLAASPTRAERPEAKRPEAKRPAPTSTQHRMLYTVLPPPPIAEVELQRVSTRFKGVRRRASLSLIPDVIEGVDDVLVLHTDEGRGETVVGPLYVDGRDADFDIRFRRFFGQLYLEIRVVVEFVTDHEADLTLLLYRIPPDGPPVKVLEEFLELAHGSCGFLDTVALKAAPGRELRVVVERKRIGARSSADECRGMKSEVRSQTYTLRDDCFVPGVEPLFFAPEVARLGGSARDCDTSLCPIRAPGPWSTRDLIERRLHGPPLLVATPSDWLVIERSMLGAMVGTVFGLADGCRVIIEVAPRVTASRFIQSHAPWEIYGRAQSLISSCCRREKSYCASLPRVEPWDPACEPILDKEDYVCGEVYRYHARDASMIFDAVFLRVPQENESSVVLKAMLACDETLYGEAVRDFTAMLRSITSESGTSDAVER